MPFSSKHLQPFFAGRFRGAFNPNSFSQTRPMAFVPTTTKKYPLNYPQQNLWLDWLKFPQSNQFHEGYVFQLEGKLNVTKLENVLAHLVNKHSLLCVGFSDAEGTLCQYKKELPQQVLHINTSQLSDTECRTLLAQAVRKPFDLRNDYPFRFNLVQQAPDRQYLALVFHHIVADASSCINFFKELSELYNTLEFIPELKPLESTELDTLAQHQTALSKSGAWEQSDRYWQNYLADAETSLELPYRTQYQPKHNALADDEELYVALSPTLSAEVRQFAKENTTSVFRIMLASFEALLSRYSQQEAISLNYVVSKRPKSLANAMGHYISVIPKRVTCDTSTDFHGLLTQIATAAVDTKEVIPYDFLKFQFPRTNYPVPEINFGRSLFLFEHVLQFNELSTTLIPVARSVNKLEVTYDDGDYLTSPQPISLRIKYNLSIFSKELIDNLIGHYQNLLSSALKTPTLAINQLSLLTPAEQQTLMVDWNQTQAPCPQDKTIHQLFEEQVQRTPDNIALVFEDRQLSYRDVNQRANQLAHYLQAQGVTTNTLVAISVERSPALMIAILAILKAGGIYVPLDPDYPQERLDYILEDTQAPLLLVSSSLQTKFTHSNSQHIVLDQVDVASYADTNPTVSSQARDLAYIIYTSGSTGKPKGVMLEHLGVCNLAIGQNEVFNVCAEDKVLQFCSINFDGSVSEWITTLTKGAALVMVKSKENLMGEGLSQTMQQHGITMATISPSVLTTLSPESCPSLKTLIVAGEATPEALLRKWSVDRKVINAYGPTEITVCASMITCDAEHSASTIGRPLANTQLYVLDKHLQPVPVGVNGELYIGGIGVARGYFKRPDLTAERFIPNPFASAEDLARGYSRLYKTGDLVRYLPDGNLDYVGRSDFQVKLRGVRIELGEIESSLTAQENVQSALVIVKEVKPGDKRLVAYVVLTNPEHEAETLTAIRQALKQSLPSQMVPSHIIALPVMPLTPNKKIDRNALEKREIQVSKPALPKLVMATPEEGTLLALWAKLLGHNEITLQDSFFDVGGSSLLAVKLYAELPAAWKTTVTLTDVFQHPTISSFANHVRGQLPQTLPTQKESITVLPELDVAIVGMACRLPGADTIEQFWANLQQGKETLSHLNREQLIKAGVSTDLVNDPQYVGSRGRISNVQNFDADFFHVSAKEAQILDPQQRLFLECAWEALETAGYDPSTYKGDIGVFAGSGMNHYLPEHLRGRADLVSTVGAFALGTANDTGSLATRVAYKFNLTGPAVAVQTACSTSLVAVHIACQSLRTGESGMVLAGGVSLGDLDANGYLYQPGMILSKDGHCRAFDANATGTVVSQGMGIVVLKRLTDAIKDGDTVYAVIKGSAINNDGSLKVGFTAPNAAQQAAVIQKALAMGGIHPDSIDFVETHGTGTALGDPIEWEGLSKVFGTENRPANSLALGALKTSIGHTDAAAGAVGLIKTALGLHHQKVPATLHFTEFNPRLKKMAPFYINSELVSLSDRHKLLRAGVSSFGVGGTNAHVVLEQAPVAPTAGLARPWQLLTLSARSPEALAVAATRLATHLKTHPTTELADVAYTLQVGRKTFAYTQAWVCDSHQHAISLLEEPTAPTLRSATTKPPVVFVFAGQGSQYADMGRQLYEQEALFRQTVDQCLSFLSNHERWRTTFAPITDFSALTSAASLQSPHIAPVALFIIQYTLAKQLQQWGVAPQAMVGHSLGEYTAACLAGVLSLEGALQLIAMRGFLTSTLPSGKMLSVQLSPEALADHLIPFANIDLAVINHPQFVVVSGLAAEVEALAKNLEQAGVKCQLLPIAFASHSRQVDKITAEFTQFIEDNISLSAPTTPYISSKTGLWQDSSAHTAQYWAQHLRQPVQFAKALDTLLTHPDLQGAVIVEVGPNTMINALIKQHPAKTSEHTLIAAMRHPKDSQSDLKCLLKALGQLWQAGVTSDIGAFYEQQNRRRIGLPTYPFQRKRFWIEKVTQSFDTSESLSHDVEVVEEVTVLTAAVTSRSDDPTLDHIKRLWKKNLGVSQVNLKDNYFDCGGDSLSAISFFSALSKQFGLSLNPSLLYQYPTLGGLLDTIKRQLGNPTEGVSTSPLIKLQAGKPGTVPLILIHPVGGEISVYLDLVKQLDDNLPVYAFRAVSLDGTAPAFTCIKTMATHYVDTLLAELGASSSAGFQLAGASYGGIVAYDMAQQLQEKGIVLGTLLLIDAPCPGYAMPHMLANSAEALEYLLGDILQISMADLTALTLEEQLALIRQKAQQLGKEQLVPENLGKALLDTWLSHAESMWHYQPQPYTGNMIFFGHGESTARYSVKSASSWQALTLGSFQDHILPGDHNSMYRGASAKLLVSHLPETLQLKSDARTSDAAVGSIDSAASAFSHHATDVSISATGQKPLSIGDRELVKQMATNDPQKKAV